MSKCMHTCCCRRDRVSPAEKANELAELEAELAAMDAEKHAGRDAKRKRPQRDEANDEPPSLPETPRPPSPEAPAPNSVPSGFDFEDVPMLAFAPDTKLADGVYAHSIPELSSTWDEKLTAARAGVRPLFSSLEAALSRRQLRGQQPPAWLWLLVLCYERYPPASIGQEASTREAATLRAIDTTADDKPKAPTSPPTRTSSVRLLRRALVLYHPDKNRAEQYGVQWAAFCEEMAKLATALLAAELNAPDDE